MRTSNRLSPAFVRKVTQPGMHADGRNLWLRITESGRSWVFRYTANHQSHQMGLGSIDVVSLAEAREQAAEYRRLLHRGVDPIQHRRAERAARQVEQKPVPTFRQAAEKYIDDNEAGWSRQLWKNYRSLFERHVYDRIVSDDGQPTRTFGDTPVSDIDLEAVLRVLQPLWVSQPETAARARARLEVVLDAARVRGWRSAENPARWRGHLDKVLPRKSKIKKTEHHTALDYATQLRPFMEKLRAVDSIAARALEFTVLCATRTSETRFARWDEINGGNVWTIPASRMKGGREHRVPLCKRALEIIEEMRSIRTGDEIFPNLGRTTMLALLAKLGHKGVSVHGFRSAFSDWAHETTNAASHVIEMGLAHAIASGTEAAYRRGDLFEKRRKLMQQWDRYCTAPAADVHHLRVAK